MRLPVVKSNLLINSVYLLAATGVVTALGFVFWVIVAHRYSAETVGIATTLLSLSGLVSLLSLAGFDTTLVRFLPGSRRKNDYVNTGLVVVAVLSLGLSWLGADLLETTSPTLAAVLSQPVNLVAFGFFTLVTSLNTLTNSVFLAHKRAKPIFVINACFSLLKVALPLVAMPGNAMTIFVLVGVAQLAGLLLSLGWMVWQFGHRFSLRVHADILRGVKAYSSSVYLGAILNLLPPTLLPLIVTRQLGPAQAAYYYIAFAVANMLYAIAYASTQAAFAEGAHDAAGVRRHLVKAIKLAALLLVPAALIIASLGGLLLGIFGHRYVAAAPLLQLFAASGLFVAAYSGFGVVFKVTRNLRGIMAVNAAYAFTVLGGSWLLVPKLGLVGVGWAWLAGNLMACLVALAFLRFPHRARAPGSPAAAPDNHQLQVKGG